jgi:glycine cleavage system pyridoxal-binding protein P
MPADIRTRRALDVPPARSEAEVAAALRTLAAAKNRPYVQMIGLGYFDTIAPPVLRRNLLESPGWYAPKPRLAERTARWLLSSYPTTGSTPPSTNG